MADSGEISHNPGLSYEAAKAGYIDWLASCNWIAQPSLLYWWYASEVGPGALSIEGFRNFCDQKIIPA